MRNKGDSVPNDKFRFWDSLLEKADRRTNLHKNIRTISKPNGVHALIGNGVTLGYVGTNDSTWVELNINFKKDLEKTDNYYRALLKRSDQIDREYPELRIVWKPQMKSTINSRIILSYSTKGGISDEKYWEDIQNDLIDRMIKFEAIFRKLISDV